MKAGDICTKDVVTCDPRYTVPQACRLMRDRHVGDLVVVRAGADGARRPVGLLTDRDIVLAVLAEEVDGAALFVDDF